MELAALGNGLGSEYSSASGKLTTLKVVYLAQGGWFSLMMAGIYGTS